MRQLERLVVIERITNRGRDKVRPPWFSKQIAFQSLREALDAAGVPFELHLVVDHGLPAGVQELLRPEDHVQVREIGSSRGSMIALLHQAEAVGLTPQDLVWFAEDDYLYTRDAFAKLVAAARSTGAEYFSMHVPDDREWHATHPSQPLGHVEPMPGEPFEVAGETWRRITHTNSTFGAWGDVLLQDLFLLKTCTNGGSPYDHSSNMVLQGRPPFPARQLFRDLNPKPAPRTWIGPLARPPMRVVMNVLARRRGDRIRRLLAPVRELACHLEPVQMRPGHDWDALASEIADRLAARPSPASHLGPEAS